MTEIDMCGTLCPEPVLAAHRALRALPPGARLRLLADDPVAEIDVTHFCRSRGHLLVSVTRERGICAFVIERAADAPVAR